MKRFIKVLMGLGLTSGILSTVYIKQAKAKNLALTNIHLETKSGKIAGTLEMPKTVHQIPVALIIAGSGPTDRNGNQLGMKNNSLKMLAESLAEKGIASVRFDKRGVSGSKSAGKKEKEMRFDDLIKDSSDWVKKLKSDERFSHVFIIGHSEGSLIGMIAAQQTQTAGFVSIAGAGLPADEILLKQLKAQSEFLFKKSEPILAQLKQGKTVKKYPLILASLFRSSVQPYLISWFQYDPREEIKKLVQPVLIIQGNHDIQVSVEDAQELAQAQPHSSLQIIKGMNHVLKLAPLKRKENLKAYSQPHLPLATQLEPALVAFIKKHSS